MVVVAAVFAGLVARSLVAEGVAAGRRGGSGRGCRCRGSCAGSCHGRWCGHWRRRHCRRRGAGGAGLGGGMRKGRSRRRIRIVAGIIGDVADLSAMAGAPRRGGGHEVDGREAFAGHVVPAPSAAKLAHFGRGSRLDYPDVYIARRGRRRIAPIARRTTSRLRRRLRLGRGCLGLRLAGGWLMIRSPLELMNTDKQLDVRRCGQIQRASILQIRR